MNRSRWLCQFERPGFHEMARVREIIAKMDVAILERRNAFRTADEATMAGTIDEIMEVLSNVLQADFAENCVKQQHKPWGFDYVVTDDSPDKGSIEIYTRLFDPSDSTIGNVFYGRTVKRIGESTFLLWVDDEVEGRTGNEEQT